MIDFCVKLFLTRVNLSRRVDVLNETQFIDFPSTPQLWQLLQPWINQFHSEKSLKRNFHFQTTWNPTASHICKLEIYFDCTSCFRCCRESFVISFLVRQGKSKADWNFKPAFFVASNKDKAPHLFVTKELCSKPEIFIHHISRLLSEWFSHLWFCFYCRIWIKQTIAWIVVLRMKLFLGKTRKRL